MKKRIQAIKIRASRLAEWAFLLVALVSPLSVCADPNHSPSISISEPEGLAHKTFRVRTIASGTSVLYTSHDGIAYLWFPGKTELIIGTWYDQELGLVRKTETGKVRFNRICFEYPGPQRETIGKENFKSRECFWLDQFVALIVEVEEGDILNLASGKVPCRMCRNPKSLAQLQAKVSY